MPRIEKLIARMRHPNQFFRASFQDTQQFILTCNAGKPTEYYIDKRTHRNEHNDYVVKPIARNRLFFWYICPFCQMIHMESCRWLNRTGVFIPIRCKHLRKLKLTLCIDTPVSDIAVQGTDVHDLYDQIVLDNCLHAEYEHIEDFEKDDTPVSKRKRRIRSTRA